MSRRASPALRQLALAAVVTAAVAFALSAFAALRTSATDPLAADTVAANTGAPTSSHEPLAEPDIERVVAHDLFSPLRQPPAQRYTLASARAPFGDDESESAAVTFDEPVPMLPVVHGTAVYGDGSGFAMCSTGGEPARVVRIGDVVGSFTVVAIERTRVVFRDVSGHRVTVDALPSPAGEER